MKRILFWSLTLVGMIWLCFGNIHSLGASAPTIPYWDFYPQGMNYLHPSFFAIQEEERPIISITAKHSVRIMGGTEYVFMNYFYGNFVLDNVYIASYNEDGTFLNLQSYGSSQFLNNRLTFTPSVQTSHIRISMDLLVNANSVDDYHIVDKYFILCESIFDPEVYGYEELRYFGPSISYTQVNPNQTGSYQSNVDSPVTVAQLQAGLKAYDDQDGDITSQIIVQNDQYSSNKHLLGTHPVTFRVEDQASNTTTFTVHVTVFDATKPVFSGQMNHLTHQQAQLTIGQIQNGLIAMDNYDGNITTSIALKSDGYTSNYQTIGTHDVVFEVTDSSGNKEEVTVQIHVEDGYPPVFSGPTSWTIGNQDVLTLQQIQMMITAEDLVDGPITPIITLDEYSKNIHKVGTWMICFEAADQMGNTSYYTLNIIITDNTPPVFFLNQTTIHIALGTEAMSADQLFSVIRTVDSLVNVNTYSIVKDTYTTSDYSVGTYQVVYEVDGNNHLLEIHVVETKDEPSVDDSSLTFWEKVWSILVRIWQYIVRFVSNLFR